MAKLSNLTTHSLLVEWKLTVLSFFSLRFICAANLSTFFTVYPRCEYMQMSNQISRIHDVAKTSQQEQTFVLQCSSLFFARLILVYK